MDALIPENTKGKPVDLDTSVSLPTREKAQDCFRRAYKRLLNPPVWHQLGGALSAEFVLVNDKGQELERLAEVGDYLRIDVPGPGGHSGRGFDWVVVEMIEDKANPGAEEESVGMRVRACENPAGNEKDTAHFFQSDATSTFIIRRKGNTVTAAYYGRNEVSNTNTEKQTDKLRNALIALGAMAGLSELQWSGLIKGFLSKEIGG